MEYITKAMIAESINIVEKVTEEPEVDPVLEKQSRGYFGEVVDPSELGPDLKDDIVMLLSENGQFSDINDSDYVGPPLSEQIDECEWIAYVLDEHNIPVAVGAVIDGSKENWTGYVKRDFYTLRSGQNLGSRKERNLIAISPEYKNMGLDKKIEELLVSKESDLYAIAVNGDPEAELSLPSLGYIKISKFQSEISDLTLALWISQ